MFVYRPHIDSKIRKRSQNLCDILELKIKDRKEFDDHIKGVDLGLFEELEGSQENERLFALLTKQEAKC